MANIPLIYTTVVSHKTGGDSHIESQVRVGSPKETDRSLAIQIQLCGAACMAHQPFTRLETQVKDSKEHGAQWISFAYDVVGMRSSDRLWRR